MKALFRIFALVVVMETTLTSASLAETGKERALIEWEQKCYRAECCGKLAWKCVKNIKADPESQGINIEVILPGQAVTEDFRLDRVRVTKDPITKLVVGIPCRG